VDGKIYVIGGAKNTTTFVSNVEEYDPETDTWKQKAEMPTARGVFSINVVDGKIYAIGGYNMANLGGMTTVEEYDPKTDKWKKKARMNNPRYALDSSVVNGKIYAIGGSQGGSVNMVEEYDPLKDRWTVKAPMPTPREYLLTCALNGLIYAFGGMNFPATGMAFMNTVEVYDPATNSWEKKSGMPAPNGLFTCESVNRRIYIIGGAKSFVMNGQLPVIPDVYEYIPEKLSLVISWGIIKSGNIQ